MTGDDIRDMRARREWTQTDLAQRLGLTKGRICQLEQKSRIPRVMALAITAVDRLPNAGATTTTN